jgi:tetratricopeptide (TPR) repeat protein
MGKRDMVAKARATQAGLLLALVLLALIPASPRRAYAQSSATGLARPAAPRAQPAQSETEANVAKARMHFLLGMQFFEVRAYRDAIREFELATTIAPSADVWFNIGRAREELGEDQQAKAAFERYLRDRVDAPDAEAVRARLHMIQQRIATGQRPLEATSGTGSLRIHLAPAAKAGSLVTLDGKTLRESLRLQPVILPAGLHRLEVTRAGFIPFRAEVSIEPGMLTAAHPRLDPLTPAPSDRTHARSWTWVMLGVAGAGALATGILSGIAADRLSDERVADARDWARRADVALAGTAVCALAAAILYFVEAPPPAEADAARADRTGVHLGQSTGSVRVQP